MVKDRITRANSNLVLAEKALSRTEEKLHSVARRFAYVPYDHDNARKDLNHVVDTLYREVSHMRDCQMALENAVLSEKDGAEVVADAKYGSHAILATEMSGLEDETC